MPTSDQPTLSAERRRRRLGFETLLADLSSRFINLSPVDVDREIEDALRRVCELVGIDMAVLWQWTAAAPGVITPTHAYPVSAGLTTSGLDAEEQFPWTLQQMMAGHMVAIASLGDLPPEAGVDRETARHSGIKSSLILPLSLSGELPVGALALNTLRAERAWPDAVIKRLQLAAQVFTNALARRRSDQALRESEARLAAGADLAGLAFYEVEFGTGVIYVDNRLRDICGVPPERDTGLGALEFWLEHLHPDDRPRVLDEREQMHGGRKERISVEYRFLNPARGARWIHHAAGVAARDEAGRRPVYGGNRTFQDDPHWRDYILSYEYFHGDNGAGLGASHQTGWTRPTRCRARRSGSRSASCANRWEGKRRARRSGRRSVRRAEQHAHRRRDRDRRTGGGRHAGFRIEAKDHD